MLKTPQFKRHWYLIENRTTHWNRGNTYFIVLFPLQYSLRVEVESVSLSCGRVELYCPLQATRGTSTFLCVESELFWSQQKERTNDNSTSVTPLGLRNDLAHLSGNTPISRCFSSKQMIQAAGGGVAGGVEVQPCLSIHFQAF